MDMLRTGVSMLAAFDPELNDHSHDANVRKAIRLIARVSTLITDGWRISQGQEPLGDNTGPDPCRQFSLQADRSAAGGLADPDAGYDFHSLRRSRVQRLDFRRARDGFDPGRHVCRLHLGLRHAEGTAARRGERGVDLHAERDRDAGSSRGLDDGRARAEEERSWALATAFTRAATRGCRSCGRSRAITVNGWENRNGCRSAKRSRRRWNARKGLCANVDLYAAPVFTMFGFPSALNTPVFAVSRVAGWCAHVIEQHDNNRLIRPRSLYIGPPERPYKAPESKGA